MIVLALGCSAAPPSLRLPIDCDLGEDCWISNRPDVDPGPTFRDHTGGTHTYDAHGGTDVAAPHAGAAAVTWVVAPASGAVSGVRDRHPSGALVASGRDAVDGQECGNGVGIDLGAEWNLQLCHLERGTVGVRVGAPVRRGDRLGRVGWSGFSDHPHVHLTVSHAGRKVDPFTGLYLDDGTAAAEAPLWSGPLPEPSAIDALAWAGFDAGPRVPDAEWPLDGGRAVVPRSADSLVLGVFLWRPEVGDTVRTSVRRPDGTTTTSTWVEPKGQPRRFLTIEKAWPPDERPVGTWSAHVQWERGDRMRERWTSTILR